MNLPFVDLKSQYNSIQQEINSRIQTVLNHRQFIFGPEVAEFEKKLADFIGVKHCITVASGTDSLLIAMMALGIKSGDEVITSPFSFFATAEVIVFLGATPVFVDIDPKTYNIDPKKIEAAITSKTKLIVPVSLYGQCADFDAINEIALKHNIPVLEDSAQSMGATYKGKKSGNLCTISATSFFPSKPLGAYGDAGACLTNDDSLAKTIREIRDHGQDRRYHHVTIGLNGRMDTLQAAILLAKMEIFAKEIKSRQQIGERYSELLKGKVITPYVEPYNTSVYAQYTIQVNNRDKFAGNINKKGVPTAIHYPIPIHRQPIFADKYAKINIPIAELAATKVISLPMHPYLTEEQIQFIVKQVIESID